VGVLKVCLSDVLPQIGASQVTVRAASTFRSDSAASTQLSADKPVTRRAMGEEWAVVQRAIAGDAPAQEQLFVRHTSKLYRISFALLHNKEDAEDAVQDGLYKAFINLRSFEGRASFSTWLTRIVINSALTTLRRKRGHPETSLDEILESQTECLPRAAAKAYPDPEKISAASEIKAVLEQQAGELPEAMSAAFRLGVTNGFSAKESSQALGISVSAFKSRFFWARRKLICALQKRLRLAPAR